MTAPPRFRRINVEDLGEDVDPSLITIVEAINSFNQDVYSLLSSNVTLVDNIRAEVVNATFITPSTYNDGVNTNFTVFSVRCRFPGIKSVVVGSINQSNTGAYITYPYNVSIPVGGWREASPGLVQINYLTGLLASTQYSVNFLVF